MEPNQTEKIVMLEPAQPLPQIEKIIMPQMEQPTPSKPPLLGVCSVCHQPLLSSYYFCPNCGTKVNQAPLSTTAKTQAWIYLFSIILPMICFIFVTKWPGVKYFKSKDQKAHQIGIVAWTLLVISTIITIGLAYIWTENLIQSSIDSINTDFSGF